ncbi:MAG: hypothetical protein NXY57DRAFT_100720 [Lentinula lateritia]|nr:MAG: hypothetical protein NXY57DRAFT_100720 [Lentinula lateritia]
MALPNELYWDILTRVFADSVHRVCFPKSYELDLAWELNALSTFFRVSHSFQGITADICQKMYGSPDRGKNAVQSANTRLNFLRHSARRDIVIIFDEEKFKTPFLQSYLLLLSIVQMRKIMKVPSTPTLFRYMHTTIFRSVDTLQRIITLSKPPELYLNLAGSSHMQADLIYISSELVHEVDDLQENLTALQKFTPDHDEADTYMARIRLNMHSVDDFVRKYEVVAALASRLTGPEVKVYEVHDPYVCVSTFWSLTYLFSLAPWGIECDETYQSNNISVRTGHSGHTGDI